MTTTTAVRYFISDQLETPSVLRRGPVGDERFRDGQWRPTKAILAWCAGENDYLSEATEAQAREADPAAFQS